MSLFEQYEHHGSRVWVRRNLKGMHREFCLCHSCEKFKPGTEGNCPIAQDTYANCVKHNLTTPVFECPSFVIRNSTANEPQVVTLEEMKTDNELYNAAIRISAKVLIWSGEHEAYWREGCCGYTDQKSQAGVYVFEDAYDATKHCDPSKRIAFVVL